MNVGTINIRLEGITFEQTERCRIIIHKMFEAGVFNVRNGKAMLNFDHEGTMSDIEISMKTWIRKHDVPQETLLPLSQFVIEMNQDKSAFAKSL